MMTRRFGVVSRLDHEDKTWMLRQFRPTLEEALVAEIETARRLLELRWGGALIGIVTFDTEGLAHFDGYHDKIHAERGELAILLRESALRDLDVGPTPPPVHKAREARQVVA